MGRVGDHSNVPWNYFWVLSALWMLVFIQYSIPLPFFYRYMLLCR